MQGLIYNLELQGMNSLRDADGALHVCDRCWEVTPEWLLLLFQYIIIGKFPGNYIALQIQMG
jgi:hypothetical protein